jgi:hypothetical protein
MECYVTQGILYYTGERYAISLYLPTSKNKYILICNLYNNIILQSVQHHNIAELLLRLVFNTNQSAISAFTDYIKVYIICFIDIY